MKVFMFYIKGEKSPYAYTIDKEYAELFQLQRNMNAMYLKKIHMEKYEFMIFMNNNRDIQLIKDYLFDGENDIEIISTINESSTLSESCDYIMNTSYALEKSLTKLPLKKKYLKTITTLTRELTRCDKNTPTLLVNTFTLFYHLFRNTFSDIEVDEE